MVIDDNPTTLLNLENMTALVVAIGVVLALLLGGWDGPAGRGFGRITAEKATRRTGCKEMQSKDCPACTVCPVSRMRSLSMPHCISIHPDGEVRLANSHSRCMNSMVMFQAVEL